MEEEWKDVRGYEGLYQISNFGRIKAFPRAFSYINRYGKITNTKTKGGIKRASKTGKDRNTNNYYMSIILRDENGRAKRIAIHRLVAEAFLPNKDKNKEVNHKNGIKQDNRVDNLEWVTKKENAIHSFYTLKNTKNSFPSRPVVCIETGAKYVTISEAQRATGIDRHKILKAIRDKSDINGNHWDFFKK